MTYLARALLVGGATYLLTAYLGHALNQAYLDLAARLAQLHP